MVNMRRLSVVIANYNYEDFVATAIESALALDWPDVEVVVVDDGSTDRSLSVINRYSDRVVVVATGNSTQRVAVNTGFSRSSGDVVIFLDSDDVLPRDLAQHVNRVWRAGISKVQFRMQRVDADGTPIGEPFPSFRPTPTPVEIRRWLSRTSAYPTPPGSGNAYARWFLDDLMPVGAEAGDAADSALLVTAPMLGDVVTVPEVVVGYRQHSSNDSNLMADTTRFAREVRRAHTRWDFVLDVVGPDQLSGRALRRSRELLQFRVGALVSDGHPASAHDNRVSMLLDAISSPIRPGPEPLSRRVAVALWCLACLSLPNGVAKRLVRARFDRTRTPS